MSTHNSEFYFLNCTIKAPLLIYSDISKRNP